ncbi:hypothetical protein HDU92_005452 [Lobulomyces angularis]|nr:hypothetical protein HDU92_005452 [Lobulomyces angularis]
MAKKRRSSSVASVASRISTSSLSELKQESFPNSAPLPPTQEIPNQFDLLSYINFSKSSDNPNLVPGYLMFLVYPSLMFFSFLVVTVIHTQKWATNYLLPLMVENFTIQSSHVPIFIALVYFFNTYFISVWSTLTAQAFSKIGYDNRAPTHLIHQLTGTALKIQNIHLNNIEFLPLFISAIFFPLVSFSTAQLDLSLHIDFLLIVLFARLIYPLLYLFNIDLLRSLSTSVATTACLLVLTFCAMPHTHELFLLHFSTPLDFYLNSLFTN